jgi:carbon-monoxide dehydrogenase large subunit
MLFMDIVRSPYAHAKILSIDASEALKVPGVIAVLTGKDLEAVGLHWMPTLMSDTQMVLPTDRVVYQAQEVACVLAEERYAAADGVAAVQVEYEALQPVIDPFKALEADSPLVRPDKDKKSNHIWHWEAGDRDATPRAIDASDVVVAEDIYIPRIHVASIETCGCVGFERQRQLTVWMTTQAPHAIRVFSLVSKIPSTRSA